VIEPGQDVLDAENRVRLDDFQRAGAWLHDEPRAHGQDAFELHAAVQAHEPREHVDPRFRKQRKDDGLPIEPVWHPDPPALHRHTAREGAARLRECLGPVGQLRLHLERCGLVDRGDFPEDVVRLVVQLRELQVGRLELVRATWNDRGEEPCGDDEQDRDGSHRRSVASFFSMLI
jgi:hypothetical protein